MKKLFLFASLLGCMFIISCNNEHTLLIEEEIINEPVTRALSIDEPSVSNPALHDSWENVTTIKLNGGLEIDAPWVIKEGNSINIPLNYRVDIKREDGWEMLSHTLLNQLSAEPNYILFYNRYRGIIKGFYYNPININNHSFIWVLEASQPTSVFPSNDLIEGSINSKNKYVTSSNILEDSQFNFAHLEQGWNAFSFELPYGTIDNSPIVTIRGYNNLTSAITLDGNYSGEVIIPVTEEEPSGLKSIVSTVEKLVGAASKIIPILTTVKKAVGAAGVVLGQTSLYKSTTSVTNIRATSSGKINLTGTSFAQFAGAATPITNINLKRLNQDMELGLWSLSELPTFEYKTFVPAMSLQSDVYHGGVDMIPDNILSKIIINPAISNHISSYKVVETQFFYKDSLRSYETEKLLNDRYLTSFQFERNGSSYHLDPTKFYLFYTMSPPVGEAYVNITVEFTFNNGHSFISSRNFKANFNAINNLAEIRMLQQMGAIVIMI